MWKETRLFNSILILLFLFFVTYSQARAETTQDDPIVNEESTFTQETSEEEEIDSNDEPNLEFTTNSEEETQEENFIESDEILDDEENEIERASIHLASPVFLDPFFLSCPFFFTSPIFFPTVITTPIFVNPFFFSFGFSFFTDPFFFSFGFPIFFDSFFFSPFAFHSPFFFPNFGFFFTFTHFHHHHHHAHHDVHHNSSKIVKTGVPINKKPIAIQKNVNVGNTGIVSRKTIENQISTPRTLDTKTGIPIKKPAPIRVNSGIGSRKTIENQISAPKGLGTRLNTRVSNNSSRGQTDFVEGRFPKSGVSRNPSTTTIDPRISNRGTGFRLFGGRDQTISPNRGTSNIRTWGNGTGSFSSMRSSGRGFTSFRGGSTTSFSNNQMIPSDRVAPNTRTLGNRIGSFNSMRSSGREFTSFRGGSTTSFSNRGNLSTRFNPGFQTGFQSFRGGSRFSNGFRSSSFGRIGGSSFGKMGGSFRGFGRR